MIAPGRAHRPGAGRARIGPATPDELEQCPFCEGREDRTPPETFAVGRTGSRPDTPGWRVRVVPNLYPAFERQEVVVHTPRHARSLGELDDGEVADVAVAWAARAEAARAGGFSYVHAVINEGRDAGASLAHTHSQLVWLREPPPAVTQERGAVMDVLGHDELRVVERGRVAAVAHPAGRAPYELLVAPLEAEADAFASERLATALQLVAETIRRLRAVEGPVPWNAWLHTFAGDGHWHLELLPRLTVFAGIELGAEIYVNTLAPEEAAERLRAGAVSAVA